MKTPLRKDGRGGSRRNAGRPQKISHWAIYDAFNQHYRDIMNARQEIAITEAVGHDYSDLMARLKALEPQERSALVAVNSALRGHGDETVFGLIEKFGLARRHLLEDAVEAWRELDEWADNEHSRNEVSLDVRGVRKEAVQRTILQFRSMTGSDFPDQKYIQRAIRTCAKKIDDVERMLSSE